MLGGSVLAERFAVVRRDDQECALETAACTQLGDELAERGVGGAHLGFVQRSNAHLHAGLIERLLAIERLDTSVAHPSAAAQLECRL